MPAEIESLEPWREPVRGGPADPAFLTVPGIEILRLFMNGSAGIAPISRLTGLRMTAFDEGSATYVMPATGWLLGPKGLVHTGMLAFLADAPLASAIISVLPPRTPTTTAELSMTFLGDAPAAGGDLRAHGKLIFADERNGLAEVFVTDERDRLVAHGTTRCFIYPQVEIGELTPAGSSAEPEHETPDPYLRPPPDGSASVAPAGLSGLEIMTAAVGGALPLPPIDLLTGIRPVEAEQGRVIFTMPASPWLMNLAGNVYGGIIACLAKSAASGAVQTVAPAGTGFTALDVKVNYLRPGIVGGGDFTATGTVVHGGRHLAIARAEVTQNGKQVALATGSTALAP
jgi:uncharacterized protein (TIGR00369 family)